MAKNSKVENLSVTLYGAEHTRPVVEVVRRYSVRCYPRNVRGMDITQVSLGRIEELMNREGVDKNVSITTGGVSSLEVEADVRKLQGVVDGH